MPRFRAVLDTNIVLAAHGSTHATSPNVEIIVRWLRDEFELLYSDGILLEYLEKLLVRGIDAGVISDFIARVHATGERVAITTFHHRRYPIDPDDIAFVLCADNGKATHLVSYDPHLLEYVHRFAFVICQPLDFLAALRAARAS